MDMLMDFHDPVVNSITQCLRVSISHVNSVNRYFNNYNDLMLQSVELSEEIAKEYNFLITCNIVLNNSISSNMKDFYPNYLNFITDSCRESKWMSMNCWFLYLTYFMNFLNDLKTL